MAYSDGRGNALRAEEQVPSSEPESLDDALTGLRGSLARMNQYGDRAKRLHRQLEESEQTVKSLMSWKEEFLETVYRRERLQQDLDGSADAPPQRAAPCSQTTRLEGRLERLERLLSRRLEPRRVADVAVQAGEAGRPEPCCCCCCCGRRESWWPEAAGALLSACLLAGGLLLSKWASAAASVVINIGQQPL